MASQFTTVRGRRCTKVRRALTDNIHNSTAKVAPAETALPPEAAPNPTTSSKKSVYAPTTATPNPSAQIAVPHISQESQHAQVTAIVPLPPVPAPDPSPQPPPPPPPPPPPAVPPSNNPDAHPGPVVAPAPAPTPGLSQVRSTTATTSTVEIPLSSSNGIVNSPSESPTDSSLLLIDYSPSSALRFFPISTVDVAPAISSEVSLTSSAQNPPPAVAAPAPVNQPNAPSTGASGPNVAPAGAGSNGGNGGSSGGSGGNGVSGGQNQAPPALGVEAPRPDGGSPAQPALFTSPTSQPGSNDLGVGPEPQMVNSPIPVLITFTSKGVLRTTSSMYTPPPVSSIRGKGGNNKGGFTGTASPKPGSVPTAPSTVGDFTSPQKSSSTGIIAGVVSGVAIVAILCGLLFFCARRRRKSWEEKERRNSLSAEPFAAKKRHSSISARFNGFFGRKKVNSTASEESQRSNTPTLERSFGRTSMAEAPSSSRFRSSSEPASRTLNVDTSPSLLQSTAVGAAAIGAAGAIATTRYSFGRKTPDGALRLPPPTRKSGDTHRRSVSSVSGMAYPMLSETNNPFMDPDPNAPLRIINPDLSRTGTPASTPRRGILNTPTTPAMFTPTRGGMLTPTTPATGSSSLQSPLRRERPQSPLHNPFADPTSDPFIDPVANEPLFTRVSPLPLRESTHSDSQYSAYSPALSTTSQRTSLHSRSRTFTNIPQIIRTAPSVASSYHAAHGSGDSGFASLTGTATSSPSIGGTSPLQRNRGFGLGIDRTPSSSSVRSAKERNLMPLPLRTIPASPRTPPATQDPSLLSIPSRSILSGSNLSGSNARDYHHPLHRHNEPPPSATSFMSSSTTVSSTHRPLSTHSDNSSSSLSSSTMSLSFPSSWGEPGPTRPASTATMNASNETAALARSLNSGSAQSRVSDPFDLDVPELLAYASSETHYLSNEVRRGSASTAATGSNVGVDRAPAGTRR